MQEMSRSTKQTFFLLFGRIVSAGSSVCGFGGRGVSVVGDREKTELLLYLASVFVNEDAQWTGESETYIVRRDSKSTKNYWKTELLQMMPTFLD